MTAGSGLSRGRVVSPNSAGVSDRVNWYSLLARLVVVFRGDPMETRELTSWKEIASFLGVNERTAQKWETERKLPVRRLPGGRGRVAADVAALDAWKRTAPDEAHASGAVYRWPLSKDLIAEVRITGGSVTSAHLEVLRQFLDLAKNAVQER
jgi:hypothetical protein